MPKDLLPRLGSSNRGEMSYGGGQDLLELLHLAA